MLIKLISPQFVFAGGLFFLIFSGQQKILSLIWEWFEAKSAEASVMKVRQTVHLLLHQPFEVSLNFHSNLKD